MLELLEKLLQDPDHVFIKFIIQWLIVFVIVVVIVRKRRKRKALQAASNSQPKRKEPTADSFDFYNTPGTNVFSLYNIFRGILITGGAGSGKTKSLIDPIISQCTEQGFCGILYDYKYPELTNKLIGSTIHHTIQNKKTARPVVISFDDLTHSSRINPLNSKYLPKSIHAREYASAIISNLMPESIKSKDFWIRSSESLLAAVIWYLAKEKPQFCSLPHAISMLLTDDLAKLIDVISVNPESEGMVMNIKSGMKSDNQTSGILATLQGVISMLNSPEIFYIMTTPQGAEHVEEIDVNNPDDPIFLAIANNPSLQSSYSPAISLIITACLKQMNNPNKHKSVLLMDETPTCYIPNLELIPAVARSNKLATILCMQDISQLEQKYGDKNSEVLISNLATHFYGRCTNMKSAAKYSKMFGKKDAYYTTQSQSSTGAFSGSVGTSESVQQRDVLAPDFFLSMQPGHFAGHAAEASVEKFNWTFYDLNVPSGNYEPFVVSDEEPMQSFKQVKEDIRSILGN